MSTETLTLVREIENPFVTPRVRWGLGQQRSGAVITFLNARKGEIIARHGSESGVSERLEAGTSACKRLVGIEIVEALARSQRLQSSLSNTTSSKIDQSDIHLFLYVIATSLGICRVSGLPGPLFY